jgi:medium-chain acyl-[acyl-carrier-protein] hydrolase
MNASDWIRVRSPNPMAQLRLLCFPYAGGGANVFSSWARELPASVEVCAVQMPGREARITEPPLTSMDEIVEGVTTAFANRRDRPFCLFGHSLGALLAFEVARRYQKQGRSELVHLFVSGCGAPHLPLERPLVHDLPEDKFVEELRRLMGTPHEVLEDREVLSIFLPVLRADFRLAEIYSYEHGAPFSVPISAYGGENDDTVSPRALDAWHQFTTSSFRRTIFPGGHLFINDQNALFSVLSGELKRTISSLAATPR